MFFKQFFSAMHILIEFHRLIGYLHWIAEVSQLLSALRKAEENAGEERVKIKAFDYNVTTDGLLVGSAGA